jgi:DNA-binding phage protein
MPRKAPASKSKAGSPPQLDALRADAVRTLEEFEEAIVTTRTQLKVMETLLRRVRRMMESGRGASEIARQANAAQARAATSQIIRDVQAARHRAQQAQFKMAAAEGATMAEIARNWGVSRQLVSRMVKEGTPRRRS